MDELDKKMLAFQLGAGGPGPDQVLSITKVREGAVIVTREAVYHVELDHDGDLRIRVLSHTP